MAIKSTQPAINIALIDAIKTACGDHLRAIATYTEDDYTIEYVSDDAIADYGGEDGLLDQSDKIHGYFSIDFLEREMYADVLPHHGEPKASVNVMGHGVVIRYYLDDHGLYISLNDVISIDRVLTVLKAAEDTL